MFFSFRANKKIEILNILISPLKTYFIIQTMSGSTFSSSSAAFNGDNDAPINKAVVSGAKMTTGTPAGDIGYITQFAGADWDRIDRCNPPEGDSKVLGLAKNFIDGLIDGKAVDADDTTAIVMGNNFIHVVPELIKAKLAPSGFGDSTASGAPVSAKKTKAPKPGSKAAQQANKTKDDIISKNTIERITTQVVTSITGYMGENQPAALRSEYLEMRAVGFVQMLNYVYKNKKTVSDKTFVYNIIVAAKRFLDAIASVNTVCISNKTEKFSPLAQELLSNHIEKVEKTIGFNILTVCQEAPELTMSTAYDFAIPRGGIALYPHQKEIIQLVFDAISKRSVKQNQRLLARLRTSFGTGKTTIAAAIAYLAYQFAKRRTDDEKDVLVFCCSNRTVLIQVANLAYHLDVPLAVGFNDPKSGYKMVRCNNCLDGDKKKVIREPSLIVCGSDACITILQENPRAILFFDEPTIGMDVLSAVARDNAQVIEKMSCITILSSATLPEVCPEWIISSHREKFGEGINKDIVVNKTFVGVEMYNFDGFMTLPHIGSKTAAQLKQIVSSVEAHPVIRRTYTAPVLKQLYELFVQKGVPNIPNIATEFSTIDKLSCDAVCKMSFRLLECLSACPDDVVADVCAVPMRHPSAIVAPVESSSESEDDEIQFEKPAKPVVHSSRYIDYSTLGTTSAHLHYGQTLIAAPNPATFVESNFTALSKAFLKKHESIKKLMRAFELEDERINAEIGSLEKAKMTADEKSRKESEIRASRRALSIGFEINTRDHVTRYAPKGTKVFRHGLNVTILEQILKASMNVPNEVQILLACGVGAINAYSCKIYNSFVNTLFVEGALAYAVADVRIAYGTNVPLSGIIVTKEFSDMFSFNTVCQLLARVGRVGKSWKGEVFIDESFHNAFVSSFQTGSIALDIETQNLNKLHAELIAESSVAKDSIKNRLKVLKAKALLAMQTKAAAEAERIRVEAAKAKAEAEAQVAAEMAKKAQEASMIDEAAAIAERKARRSGRSTTNVSSVLSQPPVAQTTTARNPASGFTRSARK